MCRKRFIMALYLLSFILECLKQENLHISYYYLLCNYLGMMNFPCLFDNFYVHFHN